MRLPRLTTRRLMAAVAVVALVLEAQKLLMWRDRYLAEAELHASYVESYGDGRGFICPQDEWYDGERLKPEWWALCDRIRDRSADLERKYRRAARYPWLPVPPDPPWPD